MKIREILLKLAPVMTAGVIQPNGIRKDFDANESKREQAQLAIYKALESEAIEVHANIEFTTNEGFEAERLEHFMAVPLSKIKQLCGIEGESE